MRVVPLGDQAPYMPPDNSEEYSNLADGWDDLLGKLRKTLGSLPSPRTQFENHLMDKGEAEILGNGLLVRVKNLNKK